MPALPARTNPLSERVGEAWPGLVIWLLAFAAMLAVDGQVELANQALLLVPAAALAALWLPLAASLAASAVAVLAFNVAFVPPRGTLQIDLRQHALLLFSAWAVSGLVALLMARQRQLAASERVHALRVEQLRALGDALREVDDPRERAPLLREHLSALFGTTCCLMLRRQDAAVEADAFDFLGPADADRREGLWLCASRSRAMGPGTGRHEEQGAWFLPLRGRQAGFGAAWIELPDGSAAGAEADALREHAQALCDCMGLALERSAALFAAAKARDAAQVQSVRNTLLAAIAHDHRTPLATIVGAASSLHDHDARLAPDERLALAETILDEAGQLARLTDNTLQLARLDAPGLVLNTDWESAEELVGTVLQRARRRAPARRIEARVEPGLPLLRCDAVLLVQLLDNLVHNALVHGGEGGTVEVIARRVGDRVMLAVKDRGPGVPPAERERIFEAFVRRGDTARPDATAGERRGAGIGLALCRAIARAHGGELALRPRAHGGSSFELRLPVEDAPPP